MGIRIVLLSLFFCKLLNSVESQNWPQHKILDDNGIYHLYWNPPKDEKGDSEITFKVEVRTKGCFVLGFSPDGGISGSDIVSCWIKDGEVHFQDGHADASGLVIKDDQQDYELIASYQNDTSSVFEFRRKLETCDENDMVINESTMRVIYAYSGDADNNTLQPFHLPKNRGLKSELLLQSNIKGDLNLNSLLQWDITSPDINISSVDVFLWCRFVKSPQVSEKHHIVYVEPLIQEGHEEFVYHMVLYECVGGTAEEYEHLLDNRGYECYDTNTREEMLKCQGLIIAWAGGGGDIVAPEHAGFPIYPAPGKYYMFEMNYENPLLRNGIIDHSGIRFYYTLDVREYDAGSYTIGASILPRVFVPPRMEEYVVAGHTDTECLVSKFPESGGKVFGVQLHSRTLGRRMKIRHFRGNEELTPLRDDRNYDTYYQEYKFFKEEVDLLQTDQLTLECTYNSSEESTVTLGGWSTKDEICSSIVLYYPLVKGFFSYSAPTYADINMVLNTNITREEDFAQGLGNYDWGSVDMDEVQNVLRYSDHESQCYVGLYRKDEVKTLVSYPDDLIPYEPEPSTCDLTT